MKLKDKDVKNIINNIIILVDSREKLPNHITTAFDKYNIKWEKRKLLSGDYSAYVPPMEELDFDGINFEKILCIERKLGLDEISSNLSANKERFAKEFERSQSKMIILIENNTYEDLATGNYRSKLEPKQFLGLLHSLSNKYDTPFIFVDNKYSPLYIYNTFKYKLRAELKSLKA